MKSTLVDKPPRGDDWLFEVKWDGVRALAFVDNEEVRLQARSGLHCERQYPELAVIHHHIAARQAVLDGEIACIDESGRPIFKTCCFAGANVCISLLIFYFSMVMIFASCHSWSARHG